MDISTRAPTPWERGTGTHMRDTGPPHHSRPHRLTNLLTNRNTTQTIRPGNDLEEFFFI